MTDQNLTEIVCIVDRSGSMDACRTDAIGGFNAFLEEQKRQPGKALLTYTQFNDRYEIVHNGKPIQDVQPLTPETYRPLGNTALLDAVGRTINEVGLRLHNTPENQRPGKVIVVILTDGEENASHEFTREAIKEMVERQTKQFNWQFVYLGANQDAFQAGNSIGVVACAAYVGTGAGTKRAYSSISNSVSSYRSSGSIGNLNQN